MKATLEEIARQAEHQKLERQYQEKMEAQKMGMKSIPKRETVNIGEVPKYD